MPSTAPELAVCLGLWARASPAICSQQCAKLRKKYSLLGSDWLWLRCLTDDHWRSRKVCLTQMQRVAKPNFHFTLVSFWSAVKSTKNVIFFNGSFIMNSAASGCIGTVYAPWWRCRKIGLDLGTRQTHQQYMIKTRLQVPWQLQFANLNSVLKSFGHH